MRSLRLFDPRPLPGLILSQQFLDYLIIVLLSIEFIVIVPQTGDKFYFVIK